MKYRGSRANQLSIASVDHRSSQLMATTLGLGQHKVGALRRFAIGGAVHVELYTVTEIDLERRLDDYIDRDGLLVPQCFVVTGCDHGDVLVSAWLGGLYLRGGMLRVVFGGRLARNDRGRSELNDLRTIVGLIGKDHIPVGILPAIHLGLGSTAGRYKQQ